MKTISSLVKIYKDYQEINKKISQLGLYGKHLMLLMKILKNLIVVENVQILRKFYSKKGFS